MSTVRLSKDDSTNNSGAGNEPDGNGDNRIAVYVKISQEARDILDAAATGSRTRGSVIEALLKSFNKQSDPSIREGILQGQNPTLLKEHGELLQLRSWAEHAFENERYFWAGGMYKRLASHPSCTEGLKNICDYRLSLCLIRLSYDVREEALQSELDPDSYSLACRTLDKAISLTTKLRDRLSNNLVFPKLVLYYNLASCHSLKAQYLVESELEPNSDEVVRLCNAGKDPKEKAKVWKTIGQDWRNKQLIRNVAKEKEVAVDMEATKAFDDLQQIIPVFSHGKTLTDPDLILSSERVWLVDSSLKDEDLIFLRSDSQTWQTEFHNWRNGALKDRKPNSYAVESLIEDPA